MTNIELPVWGYILMALGLVAFIGMIVWYIRKNRGIKRPVFASPYVLWIIIFTVVPLLLIGYYAFTDVNGNLTLDNFYSFYDSNYADRQNSLEDIQEELAYEQELAAEDPTYVPRTEQEILEDWDLGYGNIYVSTFTRSLWMAFLCTVICLLLAYPAALFMADREIKEGAVLIVLFIVPMWMNFLLRTVALMAVLEENGVLNAILGWFGLGKQSILNTPEAVMLGMVYNFLPFMVFPIYNVLNKMDYRLNEAAMDLGCNRWQTLYKVTMPLSIPGVVSGITMVFMPAVTTFYISKLLGGNKVTLFGDLIEKKFLGISMAEWNRGSAMSLIMVILMLLSLGILRKADPKGEGGTA